MDEAPKGPEGRGRRLTTMMIDEFQQRKKPNAMNEEKEIKVRIPLDYHIKLHTVKVVQGTAISETVKAALENYFEEISKDAPAATQ
jgi:hypothetical protein